jgi:hypothetical protein
MYFEIIGEITNVKTIAVGRRIRELARLREQYGPGRWRKLKGAATVRPGVVGYAKSSCTGMRRTASAKGRSRSSVTLISDMGRKKSEPRFVVCVRNEDCEDLEARKIYRVLPDEAAAADGLLRVVDESGEDYLYPSEYFMVIELTRDLEKALLSAA